MRKSQSIRITLAIALATLPLLALAPAARAVLITGSVGSAQPIPNVQPSLGLHYAVNLFGPTAGEVAMFAGNVPSGWMKAEGQLLAVSENEALFARTGNVFGGNGQTSFALPDLRGRTGVHAGQGAGLSPRTIGQKLGAEIVTLTTDNLPAHAHTLPGYIGGGTTDFVGGGVAHTTMQPSLVLNFGIAEFGDDRGAVKAFTGALPAGFLPVNGDTLPLAQHTSLFQKLGNTYGGNGQTTFKLPDLRGRAVMHEGQGVGLSNHALGANVGAESYTLSEAHLPPHAHAVGGDVTGESGAAAPHDNLQPTFTLNYIIAVEGAFPGQPNPDEEPWIGQVELFAGTVAPPGWAFADGQLLPINGNTTLFAVLLNNFGGNGQTSFALPDLRGRVAVGAGTGVGLSNWSLGDDAGSETVTLSLNHLPPHAHTYVPEPAGLAGLALVGAILGRRRKS